MDVAKSIGPDEIHPKILKYLSSNESFINAKCKLFEISIEYKRILYICETAIIISLHKKTFVIFKSNY